MSEHRACVVGCGNRSRAHINAYNHIRNANVTACCAPTPTRREKLAEEYGIRAYSDVAEMLTEEKPDLVHLVTGPTTRVELMSVVAAHEVPACTVEKPIATGVEDWKQLVDLEKTAKTRFAVCHQMRWQKHLVRCQRALKTGHLGRVIFLDFSAGMNVAGQGTHILNYGMSLNGDSPVTEVFGAASGISGSDSMHPAPDSTAGYLTFENGVRALWNNGETAPRAGDPSTNWQHVRVAAYAEQGRTLYEEFGRWEVAGADLSESGDFGGIDTWRTNNTLAQADFHKAMLDWTEDVSKVPGTNLAQSLHEWKVVLALYASALRSKPVSLSGFDPPNDLFRELEKKLT